jgi:hypothetical protein
MAFKGYDKKFKGFLKPFKDPLKLSNLKKFQ